VFINPQNAFCCNEKFFKNIKIWPFSPLVAQVEGTREFKYAQLTLYR
jgi:hypothetical protein